MAFYRESDGDLPDQWSPLWENRFHNQSLAYEARLRDIETLNAELHSLRTEVSTLKENLRMVTDERDRVARKQHSSKPSSKPHDCKHDQDQDPENKEDGETDDEGSLLEQVFRNRIKRQLAADNEAQRQEIHELKTQISTNVENARLLSDALSRLNSVIEQRDAQISALETALMRNIHLQDGNVAAERIRHLERELRQEKEMTTRLMGRLREKDVEIFRDIMEAEEHSDETVKNGGMADLKARLVIRDDGEKPLWPWKGVNKKESCGGKAEDLEEE